MAEARLAAGRAKIGGDLLTQSMAQDDGVAIPTTVIHGQVKTPIRPAFLLDENPLRIFLANLTKENVILADVQANRSVRLVIRPARQTP